MNHAFQMLLDCLLLIYIQGSESFPDPFWEGVE
jgi:hypothetical protein